MSNFIYSLNATVPIFFVMILGYMLNKKCWITENFIADSDKIIFKIALPVSLFLDISSVNVKEQLNVKFVAFCFLSTLGFILVIWLFSEIFIKDKSIIGSFVQGSFRGSAAILGIALAQNIYGNSGLVPLMIIASVPLFNIFSVIVLTRSDIDDNVDTMGNIKKAFKGIVTNPIIVAIAIGLVFAILNIKLPTMINKSLDTVGRLGTPLALITMGASFKIDKVMKKVAPVVVATVIKLVVLPLVFIPLAVTLGFRSEELIAILIMLGAPATPTGYVMAKNMNNDYVLSSGIIVLTTMFSSVSITIIIYILKILGYI